MYVLHKYNIIHYKYNKLYHTACIFCNGFEKYFCIKKSVARPDSSVK